MNREDTHNAKRSTYAPPDGERRAEGRPNQHGAPWRATIRTRAHRLAAPARVHDALEPMTPRQRGLVAEAGLRRAPERRARDHRGTRIYARISPGLRNDLDHLATQRSTTRADLITTAILALLDQHRCSHCGRIPPAGLTPAGTCGVWCAA